MVENINLEDLFEEDEPTAVEKLDDRTIFITGEIGEDLFNTAIIPIMKLNKQEKNFKTHEPIKIYIESEGGSLIHAFALIDIIRTSEIPIHVYGIGYVASAAFMILTAGHKRFAYRNTSFLFHEASWAMQQDKMTVMKSNVKEIENTEKRIVQHLGEFTEITEDMVRENESKEWWMDTQEALKLKVIDEIL